MVKGFLAVPAGVTLYGVSRPRCTTFSVLFICLLSPAAGLDLHALDIGGGPLGFFPAAPLSPHSWPYIQLKVDRWLRRQRLAPDMIPEWREGVGRDKRRGGVVGRENELGPALGRKPSFTAFASTLYEYIEAAESPFVRRPVLTLEKTPCFSSASLGGGKDHSGDGKCRSLKVDFSFCLHAVARKSILLLLSKHI